MFRNPDAIQAYFDSLVESELTPCISAAIAYKGETAAAFTACRKNDPIYKNFTADTRLNIGSVTKIITGTFIAKLMETGRISVHDNVKKHLPEYPFEDNTVLQLLCHSTGADSFCCNTPRPTYTDAKETFIADILASIQPQHAYAPGTESRYFSYGYSILMEIIERISGKDFETFARENLFDPLGMSKSTFDTHLISKETALMPYSRDTDTYESSWDMRPTGDSGLFTTVSDLLKFAGAMQDAYHGRQSPVLTPWQAQYLFRECTEDKFHRTAAMWRKGTVDHYNFFSDFCSPEACGHTGYSGCMLCIDPTYEISIVILTNSCYLHLDWNNYRIISNKLMGALTL